VKGKILESYVSEIDQFMQKFDQEHPALSQSQKKEIEKYDRIYFLRDAENRGDEKKDIFE